MFEYNYFLRRYGVRRPEQLMSPILTKVDELDFPKNSIYHYRGDSPDEVGPGSDEFMFRKINKPIILGHITEIGDFKGNPRRIPLQVDALIRQHRVKNKRYRPLMDLESAARDNLSLICYSYCLIPQLYRYMKSLYSEYFKWWNQEAALWKNVAKVAKESDRHQFIRVRLPRILPSVPDYVIGASGEVNQRTIKLFRDPESRFLLELWKWMGNERKSSLLGQIPEECLDRVNVIFEESGKWLFVNLGLLNSWRKDTKEEQAEKMERQQKGESVKINTKGLDVLQLQKRFIKTMMVLFETRTVTVNEKDIQKQKDQIAATNEQSDAIVQTTTDALPETDAAGNLTSTPQSVELPPEANMDNDEDDEEQLFANDDDDVPTVDLELEEELRQLEEISSRAAELDFNAPEATAEVVASDDSDEILIDTPKNPEDSVKALCDTLAEQGLLSAAEYKRHMKLSESYKSIKAPNGSTLDKFTTIPFSELAIHESKVIPDISTVTDKTMLKSSLIDFDKRYITEVMQRDIAAGILNVQNAGISVTNYEVERVDDVMGSFDMYSVRIVPVVGAPSTLRFRLPVVDEDGTYVANGTKYRLRKQNGDLPIRKVAHDKVALTSYYGKVFVTKTNKKVYDYGNWLRNQITLRALDPLDTVVTDLQPGNAFDNSFVCPKLYSTIGMGIRSFRISPKGYPRTIGERTYQLIFDPKERLAQISQNVINIIEHEGKEEGHVVVGYVIPDEGEKIKFYIVMDKNNMLYFTNNGNLIPLGTMESLLELDISKAPKDFAELRVLGKNIPIGIILAHEFGLEKLIKALKISYRRVTSGARANLQPHEYALAFEDETLIFSREDELATLILAGFIDYRDAIRNYSVYTFDKKDVYLNILESKKITIRFLREIELMYQMFIDPITKEILEEMKEPTTFRGLLLRSVEMLRTDYHPDEMDPAFMRKKGYERFAGAVYSEVVKSVRLHKGRIEKSRHPIELNPHSVWMNISQDPSKILVSDINPVENLKQMESVTFGGTGGRSSRSMVKGTRSYHKNDMGTISESTVDSGDVGINVYTSADPQFTSLRGLTKRYDEKTGATALFSTSALLSPGSDQDDPKRVNFVGIQNSHTVSCQGYQPPVVRTGYEQVIAHRTSDMFAYSARKAGKVISISETGIVIEYEDGEQKGIELGRRFGNAAGLTIPHEVITDLKIGQKFNEGDIIAFNKGFFQRDFINPGNVVWKSGITVKTALMESTKTFEDSSAISKRVSDLLTTKVTYVRTVVINFTDAVRKLVKVSDVLEPEDILCIIEDPVTSNANVFDEETINTLKMLSAHTPQAKYKGKVERIVAYYHGDKEDMSESLRAVANLSDRELSARNKSIGKRTFTGRVDDSFRVEGEPIPLDSMAIQIYITADVPAGTGDKGVFANQMKTVFGDVFEKDILTESGVRIDAIFGAKSIADRIVNSPFLIGTTTTLLKVISKKAVAAYRNVK